jgi:hypothetical protein
MSCSQICSAVANACGSNRPSPATSSRASSNACSVSSVTVPAGRFGAMGWSGAPGSNRSTTP